MSLYVFLGQNIALESKYGSRIPWSPHRQNALNFGLGNRHLWITPLQVFHGAPNSNAVFIASFAGFIVGTHDTGGARELPKLDRVLRLSRSALPFFLHLHSPLPDCRKGETPNLYIRFILAIRREALDKSRGRSACTRLHALAGWDSGQGDWGQLHSSPPHEAGTKQLHR